MEAVEGAMQKAGWNRSGADKLPTCESLTLLIVTRQGRIFTLQSDLAVLKHRNFAAVGSGYQVALGAMHAARAAGWDAVDVVKSGVKAACDIISTCAKSCAPKQVRG